MASVLLPLTPRLLALMRHTAMLWAARWEVKDGKNWGQFLANSQWGTVASGPTPQRKLQPANNHVSALGSDPTPVKPWHDLSPGQHLDCSLWETLGQGSQPSHTWFPHHRNWDNVPCVKTLVLGQFAIHWYLTNADIKIYYFINTTSMRSLIYLVKFQPRFQRLKSRTEDQIVAGVRYHVIKGFPH